ncbi:MAG: ribokinase [Bacteroidales bacterium]|nr:ribokinase [Bacteroidales bacterium]
MKKIIVVGSSNTDMVIKSEKLASPGETVLGGEFYMAAGGKGANQAVAAARLGGNVYFAAKVGDDLFGKQAIENYKNDNINTDFVFIDKQNSSGIALIMVDKNAENCISVAGGANNNLLPEDLEEVINIINKDDIVLMQMEVPIKTIEFVAQEASKRGALIVLNPAPAAKISKSIIEKLFLITPNKNEAELLTGISIKNDDDIKSALLKLREMGAEKPVMTLGSKGSAYLSNDILEFVASRKVEAVDTVGAGDVFNGALCVAISENMDFKKAINFASCAASISVTRKGAQSSIPQRKEVDMII